MYILCIYIYIYIRYKCIWMPTIVFKAISFANRSRCQKRNERAEESAHEEKENNWIVKIRTLRAKLKRQPRKMEWWKKVFVPCVSICCAILLLLFFNIAKIPSCNGYFVFVKMQNNISCVKSEKEREKK